MIRLLLVSIGLIVLLSSYSWSAYKLTEAKRQKCQNVCNILLKNYEYLPQDKGMYESIVLTKHLLNKLNVIQDEKERKIVIDFLNSKDIISVLVREKYCVRIEFRKKNPFLFTWKSHYLIFHTPNSTKYGCPKESPKDCRLMPCEKKDGNNCKGEEHVIDMDSIDNHRIFITTKGHIGSPA